MKHLFYKTIRILTIPPITACLTFLVLFFHQKVLITLSDLLLAVCTISIFPILGYVIHPLIVKHTGKFKGREGQRSIAMYFCLIGYIVGIATTLYTNPSDNILLVYLGYLSTGITIFISNVFGFKLSGHAVGIAGPVALLFYFGQFEWMIGFVLMFFVILSSLKMKRHRPSELLVGVLLPFLFLPIVNYFLLHF